MRRMLVCLAVLATVGTQALEAQECRTRGHRTECRDRSRLLPDGTLVNEMDAYTVGLPIPVARLTFRVRPVDGA